MNANSGGAVFHWLGSTMGIDIALRWLVLLPLFNPNGNHGLRTALSPESTNGCLFTHTFVDPKAADHVVRPHRFHQLTPDRPPVSA